MRRFLFAASPPFVLVGLLLTVFSTNTLPVHCGGGDYPGDNPPSFGEEEMRGGPIQQTDIEESTTVKRPLEQSKKDGKTLFDGLRDIRMKVGSSITKGAHGVNQLVVSPARQKAGKGAKFVYENATKVLKPKSTAESAEAKGESANSSRSESGAEKQSCQDKAKAAERQGEQSVDEQPKEGHSLANDESTSEEKPLDGESSGANVSGTANAGRKCPVPAIAKFVSMTGGTVGPPLVSVGGKVAQAAKPVAMAAHNHGVVPAAKTIAYVTGSISKQFEKITIWKDDKQKKEEKKEEEEKKEKE
ncbi:hypothetical protein niasHT_005792 [Heterodera trifolii]|uniref:Uncharacterized protein n=1 Tax=Heterodera trifolii TaxID=157864 RepID=A0ABD2LTK3_9BILA